MPEHFVVSHHATRRRARAQLAALEHQQQQVRHWQRPLGDTDTDLLPPAVREAALHLLRLGVTSTSRLSTNERRRWRGWPWVVQAEGRRQVEHPTPPGP